MIDEYIQTLKKICAQPCISEELVEEECSLLHAGKMTANDWKRALRSPHVQTYLQNRSEQPPIITRSTIRPTTHHSVHRTILWLNKQLASKSTEKQKEELKRIRVQMGWSTLQPAPPTNSALMILFNHPLYAAAYKLGRAIIQER